MQRTFLFASAVFAVSALAAGSSTQAQTASQALDAVASSQGVQKQLNALEARVASLQNQVFTLQGKLAAAHDVLALEPFVRVDPNPEVGVTGPNVVFTGVNIHLLSGSGYTNDNGTPRGLGNLILGYDEDPGMISGDRGGSHNLVIGRYHRFTQAAFGGLVAGKQNTVSNEAASVTGGYNNTAGGFNASVTGGSTNTANGRWATVSGGSYNTASGQFASVTGGTRNIASGSFATVSGGGANTATGGSTSVTGGIQNAAGGQFTVVIGGINITNNVDYSIAPKLPFLP